MRIADTIIIPAYGEVKIWIRFDTLPKKYDLNGAPAAVWPTVVFGCTVLACLPPRICLPCFNELSACCFGNCLPALAKGGIWLHACLPHLLQAKPCSTATSCLTKTQVTQTDACMFPGCVRVKS